VGMVEKPGTGRDAANLHPSGAAMTVSNADDWFLREVLPLEAALMQFLRSNWGNENDLTDLRQDVYVRVYEAAQKQIPDLAKPFVFAAARNLLVDRVRRNRIIPIEAVADLDTLGIASGEGGPERIAMARDALRRLQIVLDRLPPRCREAIVMSKIDGLCRHEIAARMGIAEDTVRQHLMHGMRVLADTVYGERAEPRSGS
jgi:RNA polymerase sigma factor (sigma-70 family)